VFGVIFILIALAERRARLAAAQIFVSRITLGIDWRARREIQEKLAELAAGGATDTNTGRLELLVDTVNALRSTRHAWLYAYHAGGPRILDARDAQRCFQREVDDLRGRFRDEVVRAADGQLVRSTPPELRVQATEGQGTVVVSLVVAARRDLGALGEVRTAKQVHEALLVRRDLGRDDLVALEVVWSPAAENDRMSTAELEQNYPELRLIDPNGIAGRVFCRHCHGPFARELGVCPHCGAPVSDVAQGPGPSPLGRG
jgi:uncharacterized membrane protein